MNRYVIVRCLARVGTDDVQYDARASGQPWPGAEETESEWYGNQGDDYLRLVNVRCNRDMSYGVISDGSYADYPADLAGGTDGRPYITSDDVLFAAVDVARAYAWPEEYRKWEQQRSKQSEKDYRDTVHSLGMRVDGE